VAEYLARKGAAWRTEVQSLLDNPRLSARGKLLKIFDIAIATVEAPNFRGCPLMNASAEVADPQHPIRAAASAQRAYVHHVIDTLARDTGLPAPDRLAGALIVLYDGATATALIDGNPAAARQAKWAAEQLLR
jgi:hypothetical protein